MFGEIALCMVLYCTKTLCRWETALDVRYVNFLVSKPKPCWSEIRIRRGPPLITRSYCNYVYYYGCIGVFSWRSLYFWYGEYGQWILDDGSWSDFSCSKLSPRPIWIFVTKYFRSFWKSRITRSTIVSSMGPEEHSPFWRRSESSNIFDFSPIFFFGMI